MGYVGEASEVRIGGSTYNQIPDGKYKDYLIETLGPNSITKIGYKSYLKWTLRKELEEDELTL